MKARSLKLERNDKTNPTHAARAFILGLGLESLNTGHGGDVGFVQPSSPTLSAANLQRCLSLCRSN